MFLGEKDFQQLFLIKKYVINKFKVKVVFRVLRITGGMALKHSSYRERQGW